MTSVENTVEIRDAKFTWPGADKPLINLPSFTIAKGERVFLHGASGSGKTTLLGLISGVNVVQTGAVTVLGQDLKTLSGARRDRFRGDHMGYVFQQFNLLPYLSVIENVELAVRFSKVRAGRISDKGQTIRQEAIRLLSHLDLPDDLYTAQISNLSVGQQQRVAVARAFIGQPELIIADEPTSALDEDRQGNFLNLLLAESKAAGSAVLFVSHDQRLATHFDRSVSLGEINNAAMVTA